MRERGRGRGRGQERGEARASRGEDGQRKRSVQRVFLERLAQELAYSELVNIVDNTSSEGRVLALEGDGMEWAGALAQPRRLSP